MYKSESNLNVWGRGHARNVPRDFWLSANLGHIAHPSPASCNVDLATDTH